MHVSSRDTPPSLQFWSDCRPSVSNGFVTDG
jgi:hypothetical protein